MPKILSTLFRSLLAAFCAFGFLASFESGNYILWRFGYGIAFLTFVVAEASPWLGQTAGRSFSEVTNGRVASAVCLRSDICGAYPLISMKE